MAKIITDVTPGAYRPLESRMAIQSCTTNSRSTATGGEVNIPGWAAALQGLFQNRIPSRANLGI